MEGFGVGCFPDRFSRGAIYDVKHDLPLYLEPSRRGHCRPVPEPVGWCGITGSARPCVCKVLAAFRELHIATTVVIDIKIRFIFGFSEAALTEDPVHSSDDLEIHQLVGVRVLLSHQAIAAPGIARVLGKTELVVKSRGGLLGTST